LASSNRIGYQNGCAWNVYAYTEDMTKTNRTARPAKGTPTHLNVSVLAEHFDSQIPVAGDSCPNAISPTSATAIRKCVRFGYAVPVAGRLVLTVAGAQAINSLFDAFPHERPIHRIGRARVVADLARAGIDATTTTLAAPDSLDFVSTTTKGS